MRSLCTWPLGLRVSAHVAAGAEGLLQGVLDVARRSALATQVPSTRGGGRRGVGSLLLQPCFPPCVTPYVHSVSHLVSSLCPTSCPPGVQSVSRPVSAPCLPCVHPVSCPVSACVHSLPPHLELPPTHLPSPAPLEVTSAGPFVAQDPAVLCLWPCSRCPGGRLLTALHAGH